MSQVSLRRPRRGRSSSPLPSGGARHGPPPPGPGGDAPPLPSAGLGCGAGRGRRLLSFGLRRDMANVKVAVRVRPLSKRCGPGRAGPGRAPASGRTRVCAPTCGKARGTYPLRSGKRRRCPAMPHSLPARRELELELWRRRGGSLSLAARRLSPHPRPAQSTPRRVFPSSPVPCASCRGVALFPETRRDKASPEPFCPWQLLGRDFVWGVRRAAGAASLPPARRAAGGKKSGSERKQEQQGPAKLLVPSS